MALSTRKRRREQQMTENQKILLLIDDDKPFVERLGKAMAARGFEVRVAHTVAEGISAINMIPPNFAVIDLHLADGNGLAAVEALHASNPTARAVMLTGYGNIASAITAVKLGAVDYLTKPTDADAVCSALLSDKNHHGAVPENPMSADRVRWEHILRVFELCDHNVSETARRLKMHRRTLQRILAKHAPR
jgi:two-component system response regulator RegA